LEAIIKPIKYDVLLEAININEDAVLEFMDIHVNENVLSKATPIM